MQVTTVLRMQSFLVKGHRLYLRIAAKLNWITGTDENPLYFSGQLSFVTFLIAALSGIYLFVFFQIDPAVAYQSVEEISSTLLGSLMRGVHRYSSDAFIVFSLIHFLHTLLLRKYHLKIAWFSGIVMIFVMGLIGLSGFILVWDAKAKLLGLLSAQLLTTLPIFEPTLPIAFVLKDPHLLGGFFRVMLFAHLFFSLGVLILFWIHVMRMNAVRLLPPRNITLGLLALFGILALVVPVRSDPPATSLFLPLHTTWDWYYFAGYQLLRWFSPTLVWILWVAAGIVLFALPFLPKVQERLALSVPEIDVEQCDGCRQCYLDCPYSAITMRPTTSESAGQTQRPVFKASIDPALCVRCGICIASCHLQAISALMPEPLPAQEAEASLLIYACGSSLTVEELHELRKYGTVQPLACIGDLHPAMVAEQWRTGQYNGVMLLHCERCYYRLGPQWTQLRLSRYRRPQLPKDVPTDKITMCPTSASLAKCLAAFQQRSEQIDELVQ